MTLPDTTAVILDDVPEARLVAPAVLNAPDDDKDTMVTVVTRLKMVAFWVHVLKS